MVSEKYINQLLADLEAAHKKEKSDERTKARNNEIVDLEEEFDPEEYFRDVENYLAFDASLEPSLGHNIGIQRIQFPKAEDLELSQIEVLISAFNLMLNSHNVYHDLPKELPQEKYYTLLISILDESVYLAEDGMTTWEFCTYDPETCPIGEHCHCLQYEIEYQENLEEARVLLEGIIESCEGLITKYKTARLEISQKNEVDHDLMFMYIAAGSDHVAFEIYHLGDLLQKACNLLKELFAEDAEVVSLFDELNKYKVHENLRELLSMKVGKFENGVFYVEAFYIDNGLLYKGVAPVYTPEELMDRLEIEEDELDRLEDEDELPY
jgi:hypothetical protein